MRYSFDINISELEANGVCFEEISNDESEKVAGGGSFRPSMPSRSFNYLKFPYMPSAFDSTDEGTTEGTTDGAQTTVTEGDGWKSTETIYFVEKYTP
jgi:hypothetical protein